MTNLSPSDPAEPNKKEEAGEATEAKKLEPVIEPPTKTDSDEAHPYFNSEAREKAKRPVMLYLAMVAVVALAAFLFTNRDSLIKPDALVMPEALGVIERADALEKRIALLEKQLQENAGKGASASPTVVQESGNAGIGEGEFAALRGGLANLSQGLSALQLKLDESSKAVSESKANAQSGIATVLAFTQMQRKALAGMPFEKERLLLKSLAGQEAAEADRVAEFEALALTGAPTYVTLQKEWAKVAAEAQAALRKAGAQTWLDRLIVAIENLVSIRSLNPQAGDMLSFASVDVDLEHGDLLAARAKVQAMPEQVQAVLKNWSERLAMRIELETKLDQMTTYLIGKGKGPETPDATPALPSVEVMPQEHAGPTPATESEPAP